MASDIGIKAVPAPEYEKLFKRDSGWVGADGDYSVPMPGNRVLWLFSDTFVGEVRDGKRVDCTMINNSAAVQRLDGKEPVRFYYRRNKDGTPASLIAPDDGRGYFWIFAGIFIKDSLYLFLPRIENTNEGTVFAFRVFGMTLAHISNPEDPPDSWKVSQRSLDFCRYSTDGSKFFGSAVMKHMGYVYIYGVDSTPREGAEKRRSAMVVARVKEEQFANLDHWRFRCGGEWVPKPDNCDELCRGMPSEYSVSYVPSINQFAAVYTDGEILGRINVRLAPSPEGPWGEPVTVYDCPDKNWHEKTFCYAIKAHPELSESPDELIVTYATNSMHLPDLFDDARIYWPRFVRLKLSSNVHE